MTAREKCPTAEMVADIRHAMEMYPEAEVDAIVRAVEAHEGLLEAAKVALEWLDRAMEGSGHKLLPDQLRAAIAKGEEA